MPIVAGFGLRVPPPLEFCSVGSLLLHDSRALSRLASTVLPALDQRVPLSLSNSLTHFASSSESSGAGGSFL